MALDVQQERQQAHALLDLLPADKLGAVRTLLEVMVDAEDGELNSEDRAAILAGLHSMESQGTVSMEEVLSDFGLTLSDFERMADEPETIEIVRVRHRSEAYKSTALYTTRMISRVPVVHSSV